MDQITYGVVKEIYYYKEEAREAYGLVVYSDAEEDGTATIIASAHDLTDERERMEELAERCNEDEVELLHFDDIVEDFLVECYT